MPGSSSSAQSLGFRHLRKLTLVFHLIHKQQNLFFYCLNRCKAILPSVPPEAC